MTFPKCFELSKKALFITFKFAGLKPEDKALTLENLIRKLDERIQKISVGYPLSDGGNLF